MNTLKYRLINGSRLARLFRERDVRATVSDLPALLTPLGPLLP
ncbi:MAG: hypothetical protein ACRERU_17860 [Methylococcales bacterium]